MTNPTTLNENKPFLFPKREALSCQEKRESGDFATAQSPNTEPQTLNEIPLYEKFVEEEDFEKKEYDLPRYAPEYSKDVQRLVCRRIIRNRLWLQIASEEYDRAWIRQTINDDMRDFNITDAMIEEERKRMKP